MKKALVVLCLLVGLSGCTPQAADYDANPAALRSFDSPATLAGYFNQNASGASLPGPLDWLMGDRAPQDLVPYYPAGSAISYDPTLSSVGGLAGSSIQDLWANEMDTACMRDGYLYVIDDYGLSIVKAVPADQMEVVGRFPMLDPTPQSMYLLDGQKAVVLTNTTYSYCYPDDPAYDDAWLPDGESYFDVCVLDLQDPARPTALARYSIQGNPIAVRVVGDKVVALAANYPALPYYYEEFDNTMTLEQILPQYRLIDAEGNESAQPLLTWDAVLRPANPDGNAVLAVVTIDLANPGIAPAATGFLGYWESAYATPTSLYLTNTPNLPAPASQPSLLPAYRTTTEIHRFDLTGPDARYAGSLKLDGRPATYDAFNEKDGMLRAIMAAPGDLADLLSGNLFAATYYLLKPTNTGLEIAGQVAHIVDEINPYSSYYLNLAGPYAVVSGYKGESPEAVSLVVDMAEPAQPTLLGESALPGDWANLQMLDATHMLAMGSRWTAPTDPYSYSGSYDLCLYDTTEILKPILTHSLTIGQGYTDSDATWYHQEMFLADGLFVLPINLYEGTIPNDAGLQTFGGLYAYHLSIDKGFEPLGRVETAETYRYVYWNRPIVQDGILYAVTNAGIRAVSLDNMDTVLSSVHLPE